LSRRAHKQIKPFLVVAVAFLGAIFTNMKTLQYANVETFIVFRSSTPLLIALLDYAFLGRELPSLRSWCSLLLLLCGAFGYVMYDADFEVSDSRGAAGEPVTASWLGAAVVDALGNLRRQSAGRLRWQRARRSHSCRTWFCSQPWPPRRETPHQKIRTHWLTR